jgi:hypothetical protein
MEASICILEALPASIRLDYFLYWALGLGFSNKFVSKMFACSKLYHRERILETSTLSCNEEEEEITKPPTR